MKKRISFLYVIILSSFCCAQQNVSTYIPNRYSAYLTQQLKALTERKKMVQAKHKELMAQQENQQKAPQQAALKKSLESHKIVSKSIENLLQALDTRIKHVEDKLTSVTNKKIKVTSATQEENLIKQAQLENSIAEHTQQLSEATLSENYFKEQSSQISPEQQKQLTVLVTQWANKRKALEDLIKKEQTNLRQLQQEIAKKTT